MKRETSSYERIMFYYSSKGPMYFAFRLNIKGSFSENELNIALGKAREVYPLTGVRVEKTEDKKVA